ncbi:unnamed protein product [Arctia plantaginis]|uniref:Uncharacterized protein n=1 Tax=Arctia plantaginis TaxID=874455 RepID=A0A8S1BJX2_ARCPL|nr:unnamed protein product [Arctia plantaginis]
MPGTNKPRAPIYDYDDDRPPSADNDRDTDTPKTAAKKQESKSKDEGNKSDAKNNKGGGWLGGILNKLSLRAPNQMILPDDKNPSIVWDPDTKRWRNVDGDSDETDQPPPPPPKTADLPHVMKSASPPLQAAIPPAGAPPMAPQAPISNIFKMQKGRHIKKSYVDVFNPSGAATRALPPAADVLGPPPPPAHHRAHQLLRAAAPAAEQHIRPIQT